jgi:DNA-binding transcriptional LysR family regulator
MNEFNINKLDLNLLRTLNVLLEECNVSRAADRLSLSQSAVSHALSRLREQLDDPLFIRKSRGMVPTPRAQQIAGRLRHILADIDQLVGPAHFDPAVINTTLKIASADYGVAIVLPHVLDSLNKEAPGVSIEICDWNEDTLQHLKAGSIDLALGGQRTFGDCHHEILFRERFVSVVRRGHPVIKQGLTRESYLQYKHMQVDMYDSRMREIDLQLESVGLKRHVVLQLPYFTVTPLLIEKSDLIVTLPVRLANKFRNFSRLEILDLPVDLGQFPYAQVWDARRDDDPLHTWLRELMREQCKKI